MASAGGIVANSRRIATALCILYGLLFAARMTLAFATGSLNDQNELWFNVASAVLLASFPLLFLAVGYAIVVRQPRNTIGWLLIAIPLVGISAFFVGDYATLALRTHPGSLPFGRAAAWLDRWLIVAALGIFIPLFLLFPDGRVPSPRWRPALWLVIGSSALTIVGFALTPGPMTGAFADLVGTPVTNPLGIDALAGPIATLTRVGGLLMLVSAIVSGAAIVVRFRSSSAEVRQQIKWLAFVGVAFLVEIPLTIVLDVATKSDAVGSAMFLLGFGTLIVGIPLACGVAILKYRLYDLDVVVRKTVVFGLLAAFIAVVYAGVVGAFGVLVEGASNGVASFVAATVLALAFQPARDRARRLADRLVYGERATPYEVLTAFSARVGEAYAADDVLPRMAQVLASGTGADTATVWLRVGSDVHPVATYPLDGQPRRDHVVEVVHRGDRLGELSVGMPPSDPIDPAKDKLIRDLAAQAGLVLRNERLIEELRASRQRLVAAQDEERRKIERDLHDGVQQQLVALNVQLGLLARAADDPSKVTALASTLQTRTSEALNDLRDLARGIYPPLLADQGLPAALEAQARKAAVPTAVSTDGVGRYPQETEAAVYFCALEALNNVAKYAGATAASVRLEQSNGSLRFEVTDDGAGFDPSATGYGTGLQGMADRLDAIGGQLSVRSAPGTGTTIRGAVPVRSDA